MLNMDSRRVFLKKSGCGLCLSALPSLNLTSTRSPRDQHSTVESFSQPPAFSVIPVIGDGKWIWNDPPKETGLLEPREFEVSVGMRFTGRGDASELYGSTVALTEFPEQKILDTKIENTNCEAKLANIADGVTQLQLYAPSLGDGQQAHAEAKFHVKLFKSYHGFDKTRFPEVQEKPKGKNPFTGNSPGIRISSPVKKLSRSLVDSLGSETHPWDISYRFYQWVRENIKGVPGKYTSVEQAIENRKGDCEERACTFIALCRSIGIPARQVWIPSHVWAEIALHDHDGKWHWIPIHTAAYSWFGWTGAHEVVLQKGDNIRLPGRRSALRLVDDWYRIKGRNPKREYTCEIRPVELEGESSGPGSRKKLPNGQWQSLDNSENRRFSRGR